MNKRHYVVIAVGLAALLITGGLMASNMGFKLNYPLLTTETVTPPLSKSGTNSIALPYNAQTSLATASDLKDDINAAAGSNVVLSLARFAQDGDNLQPYTTAATNWSLFPGEGYRVQVSQDVDYIIVGSHNPAHVISLLTTSAVVPLSKSGTNSYAFPYHGTAASADDIKTEINAAAGANVVLSIAKFMRDGDNLQPYTSAGTNWAVVPGESYRIQVSQDVPYTPSHY